MIRSTCMCLSSRCLAMGIHVKISFQINTGYITSTDNRISVTHLSKCQISDKFGYLENNVQTVVVS
jgi:hypothetical protein